MNKKENFFDFCTNKYPLSKTLRFELIPVGETKELIREVKEKKDKNSPLAPLILEDEEKNKLSKEVKALMDDLYRDFLDFALNEKKINEEHKKEHEKFETESRSLYCKVEKHKECNKKYRNFLKKYGSYNQAEKQNKKELDGIKQELKSAQQELKGVQKKLAETLKVVLDDSASKFFEKIYVEKKEILSKEGEETLLYEELKKIRELREIRKSKDKSKTKYKEVKELYLATAFFLFLRVYYIKDIENTKKIKEFDKFLGYFNSFLTSRKNIFDTKGKGKDNSFHFLSTSIAHRLFEENISFHFDNIKKWERVEEKLKKTESDLGFKLEDILQPQSFVKWFSQEGIDQYNEFLGGKAAPEGEKKIKGLNELINSARQNIKDLKKGDLPSLTEFHKQILSDRETFVEVIESDGDLCTEIDKHIKNEEKLLNSLEKGDKKQDLRSFEELLEKLKDNKGEIYIKKDHLRFFSHDLTSNWSELEDWHLRGKKKTEINRKSFTIEELEDREEVNGSYQKLNFYDHFIKPLKEDINRSSWIKDKEIKEDDIFFSYFKAKFKDLIQKIRKNSIEELIKNKIIYIESLENTKKEEEFLTKKEKDSIKKYLDASQNIFRFFRNLNINKEDLKKGEQQNTLWVKTISEGFLKKNNISKLYNKARNFLTKKEYSTEKFKLNFENAHLCAGWHLNRETSNLCVLLMKDEKYYLGVMNKEYNNTFEKKELNKNKVLLENNKNNYRKVVYKQTVNVAKEIKALGKINGKVESRKEYEEKNKQNKQKKELTLEEWQEKVLPKNILGILETESYRYPKKENFSKKDLKIFIEHCKDVATEYWKWKEYELEKVLKEPDEYKTFSEFTDHIRAYAYKITFQDISTAYIDHCVKEGKLYLFQIYNKDFSTKKKKKGMDNLHTLYWKALFDEENLKNESKDGSKGVVVKLNGGAELFYRKASIFYDKETMEKGHHAEDLKDKFGYPIIKDKRYTRDKIFFHCPIMLNFTAKNEYNINEEINECLKNEHQKVNIIGIDRGERNLLSYSVIDQEGNIIEQGNLNSIDNGYLDREVDYHARLEKKEKKRRAARLDWKLIENIKELKEGYLSQVVHKIAKMVVKHNAIVVLEDLSMGFKRGRMKFEKQVYQKFEESLIHKLNYLVFKDKKLGELGHILQAYQLANKFEGFKKLDKQSGILFYTTAAYTSRTDPVTGYMQSLYPQYVKEEEEKAKIFFGNFKSIVYNGTHFKFTYCLEDLKEMRGSHYKEDKFDKNTLEKEWTIHSHVDRSRSKYVKNKNKENKREWEDAKINESIKELFENESSENKDFQLREGKDYKDIICKNKAFDESNKFLAKLTAHFKRLLDMRVYGEEEGKKTDYILSPVEPFYDSRKITRDSLPKDSDMNGAYNIARKGILIIENIKKKEDGKTPDLRIFKKEWMKYVQDEEVIRKQKAKYKEIVNNQKK